MGRFTRLRKWLADDIWSGVGVLSCAVAATGASTHSALGYLGEMDIIAIIISLLVLPAGLALTAYPQIAMTVVVRNIESRGAKAVGAISSLGLAWWYAIWATGADLSGSSTASVALVFYPIMVQGWAWLIAFAAVCMVARMRAR